MSCLCQDRFKQTTADIVEEKPRFGGFFATKFAYVLIRPMPLGQRFGWARRVSSGKRRASDRRHFLLRGLHFEDRMGAVVDLPAQNGRSRWIVFCS